MKRVAVFGMGYVGCVTAACLGRDGHHVIGVDIDPDKIAMLQGGTSPVAEPGLAELIQKQVTAGSLEATTNVELAVHRSQLALVAVGTPSAPDGHVDSRAVEGVVQAIGQVLGDSDQIYTIVVRSTLLPGILEDRIAPALAETLGSAFGTRVALCNNPEFLRETTAISDYNQPPFVLVGATEPHQADEVLELYGNVQADKIVTDTKTAALVKYACNAFHALKIDFANEVGTLARAFGADGQEVMKVVCRDRRLNVSPAYLRPGFAFGGSCLPKDVRALVRFAQRNAIRTELLSAILPSNEAHLERALKMVQETGRKRIGLVGLSFKAGSDDLRESPLVILAETLLGRGYELKIYDPGVRVARLVGSNLTYVDLHLPHLAALLVEAPGEILEHSELLVLGTDIAENLPGQGTFAGEVIDLRRDLVAAPTPLVGVQ